jgi:hypothetical protein
MTLTITGANSIVSRRRFGDPSFARLSLAQQFMLAGACVLAAGMLAIGFWVTDQIERGVTRNSAISTALYMDSVISPLVQELGASDELSPAARAEVDEVLTSSPLGQRLVSFKIWQKGGRVACASRQLDHRLQLRADREAPGRLGRRCRRRVRAGRRDRERGRARNRRAAARNLQPHP